MNSELLKKHIKVLEYGSNISCLFEDKDCFSPGEYKLLRGFHMPSLADCIETRLNGSIQLIYRTRGYRSFRDACSEAGEEGFSEAAEKLLRSICEIEQNTFLSCLNLDLSFDHIFIDPRSLRARLLYLPLDSGLYRDFPRFERRVRMDLSKVMMDRGFFTTRTCADLLGNLQNMQFDLKTILSRLENHSEPVSDRAEEFSFRTVLTLAPLDSKESAFVIDRGNYVVGRSTQDADGVISGSRAVGRRHCRISWTEGSYRVEDLESVNGTFLNGKRLDANIPAVIKDRDLIRIADREFRVCIRERGNRWQEKKFGK